MLVERAWGSAQTSPSRSKNRVKNVCCLGSGGRNKGLVQTSDLGEQSQGVRVLVWFVPHSRFLPGADVPGLVLESLFVPAEH